MQFLWLFLPDEFLVLVIALVGLAVMIRLVRLRTAGIFLGSIVLMLLLTNALHRKLHVFAALVVECLDTRRNWLGHGARILPPCSWCRCCRRNGRNPGRRCCPCLVPRRLLFAFLSLPYRRMAA